MGEFEDDVEPLLGRQGAIVGVVGLFGGFVGAMDGDDLFHVETIGGNDLHCEDLNRNCWR